MKNLRLITLLVAFALTGCLQGSAQKADSAPLDQTFCEQWQHLGEEPNGPALSDNQRFMFHLGSFLSVSDKVRARMKEQTGLDDKTLDSIQQCYEENTPTVVWELDSACGKQATDKQVKEIINGYYNWCIEQSQKTA